MAKKIKASQGCPFPGLEPENDEQLDLLRRWEKEFALIYAEEYTQALQHHVFVPDERGYCSHLDGPVCLAPRSPFYVGCGFKFVMSG